MTTNCPWCGKPVATEEVNRTLPKNDKGEAWCWAEYNGDDCPNKPTFDELLATLIKVTRAADEEDEGAVLSFNPASAASLAQWIRQQAKEGA